MCILPQHFILKLSSVVEKISDLELPGEQSYSLANLSSALKLIITDTELISDDQLDTLCNRMTINHINCFILMQLLKYRDFILDSTNIYFFQRQLKSKYICNGYLFLQDESYFFQEMLNFLSKNEHPQEKYDAIVITLERLQNINKIAKEFTVMHCESIELTLNLINELELFLQKKPSYPSNQGWDRFSKSENIYIERIKETLVIANKNVESYSPQTLGP